MDKTALVGADFAAGEEVLKALDQSELKITVALWVYSSDHEDWRLLLTSRMLDSLDLQDAYRLVHDRLSQSGFPAERVPPVIILSTKDPFVRTLRRLFAKAQSVAGMRLGGQSIGNRFIEDAYALRIS